MADEKSQGMSPQCKPAESNQGVVTIEQWCGKNGYDGVTKECLISASQQDDPKVVQMAQDFMKQVVSEKAGQKPDMEGKPAPVRVGPPNVVAPQVPGKGNVKIKKPGGGY